MESYNVFCYADDLILTSITVTGLQSLIDASRDYITSHGLNFNPSKTTCTTFGTTHQVVKPTWILNGTKLKQDNAVTYLGTRLSNHTHDHIDYRITAARRAFYGLQSVGLCAKSANPFTIAHIYKTANQPILIYSCSTLNLKHTDINELEKVQASLIKTALGLSKYSRNTQILRALNLKKISRIIDGSHLSLTKAALHNTSKSRTFYLHIMHKCQYYRINKHSNILQRSKIIGTSNPNVTNCRYLGITFSGKNCDLDLKRQKRRFYANTNMLLRKFVKCSPDVKCYLFKTYCCNLYCAPFWYYSTKTAIKNLKVAYNNNLRRLLGLPSHNSASSMLVNFNIPSFGELLRKYVYNYRNRLETSENVTIPRIINLWNLFVSYSTSVWHMGLVA